MRADPGGAHPRFKRRPIGCSRTAAHSARSLRGYLDLVRLVNHKSNPHLTNRLLVTMFDRRNRISHIILEQIKSKYGTALFDTVISIDTKLRESPIFGKPITQYAPNARGAQEYRALAMELMTYEQTRLETAVG